MCSSRYTHSSTHIWSWLLWVDTISSHSDGLLGVRCLYSTELFFTKGPAKNSAERSRPWSCESEWHIVMMANKQDKAEGEKQNKKQRWGKKCQPTPPQHQIYCFQIGGSVERRHIKFWLCFENCWSLKTALMVITIFNFCFSLKLGDFILGYVGAPGGVQWWERECTACPKRPPTEW